MNERPEDVWGGKHRDYVEMCELGVKKPVLKVCNQKLDCMILLTDRRGYTAPTRYWHSHPQSCTQGQQLTSLATLRSLRDGLSR